MIELFLDHQRHVKDYSQYALSIMSTTKTSWLQRAKTKTKTKSKTKTETKRKTKTKKVPHMIYTISPQVMFGMVHAIMILSRTRGTNELGVCEKKF